MKRVVATTPSFFYGSKDEVVVDIETLLEEVLTCYQKCILYAFLCLSPNVCRTDMTVHVNACSELYVDIINKKLSTISPTDIPAFWSFVCDISKVVMGDAPLIDIFSTSWSSQKNAEEPESPHAEEEKDEADQGVESLTVAKSDENEKEWMWQASLLSLEGSYTVIRKLFDIVDESNPIIYRMLSELIRLCCHSTTISYEGSQLECIQVGCGGDC